MFQLRSNIKFQCFKLSHQPTAWTVVSLDSRSITTGMGHKSCMLGLSYLRWSIIIKTAGMPAIRSDGLCVLEISKSRDKRFSLCKLGLSRPLMSLHSGRTCRSSDHDGETAAHKPCSYVARGHWRSVAESILYISFSSTSATGPALQ